jgi:hypothetical protein
VNRKDRRRLRHTKRGFPRDELFLYTHNQQLWEAKMAHQNEVAKAQSGHGEGKAGRDHPDGAPAADAL